MTIRDLPSGTKMEDVQFINPYDNEKYWWISQWDRGVWGKKDKSSSTITPIFVEDLSEVLDWEVVQH